jgi:hypothetical protein
MINPTHLGDHAIGLVSVPLHSERHADGLALVGVRVFDPAVRVGAQRSDGSVLGVLIGAVDMDLRGDGGFDRCVSWPRRGEIR